MNHPPENYEEVIEEVEKGLTKHKQMLEMATEIKIDEMLTTLVKAKELRQKELELEREYRLVRDQRMRCGSAVWEDALKIHRLLGGLPQRTDLQQDFQSLLHYFKARGAKAARTRKTNAEQQEEA